MPDLVLLLQFSVLSETLSFTAAARRIGVAQPWLSARIRKLEAQLGFALFDRTTRRVVLTPAGEELARLLGPCADEARKVEAGLDKLKASARNVVRIGCPQLGGPDRRQAELIAQFRRDCPAMSAEIEPGRWDRQLDQLRSGALDVALVPLPPEGGIWESVPLHRLALALMMHATDPLAKAVPLWTADLAGRRIALIGRHRAPALHDLLYAPILAAGALPIEVPELRRSLLQHDPDLIVSTLVAAPAEAELKYGVCRRELADAPELRLHAVRFRPAQRSDAAARFWAIVMRQGEAE